MTFDLGSESSGNGEGFDFHSLYGILGRVSGQRMVDIVLYFCCCSACSNHDSLEDESMVFSTSSKVQEGLNSCSESPQSPILPPCRICHAKASGIHYGLNTCEACKGFFRRTLKRNTTYKCNMNGKCDVVQSRSSCACCRFKKCLELGMSKAAIKTGRYTHELRYKNILEVKQIASDYVKPITSVPTSKERCDTLSHEPPSNGKLNVYLNKDIMAANQEECTANKPSKFLRSGESVIGPVRRSSYSKCLSQKCMDVGMATAVIKTDRHSSENIMEGKYLKEMKNSERVELETLISKAVEAQNQLHENMDTIFNTELMLRKQKDIHDKYKLKLRNTGGVVVCNSLDEQERQRMICLTLADMECTIRGTVQYAKVLPGFTSLSLEEQAELIKQYVFESWMISCSMCYNKELQVFAEVMNNHVDEFTAMWGQDVVDVTLKGMERLQKLKLTKDEMAVFRAICITYPDRGFDVKTRDQLEEMNWRYVQCLRCLAHKRGLSFEQRFPHIINAILCIRESCELFNNVATTKPQDWPELRESPIANEVFFT